MNQFKNLNISPPAPAFVGERIKIMKILNKQVTIHRYRIVKSKFEKGHGQRLDLQIEVNGTKYITWCASITLMETIRQIQPEQFPFSTTIVMDNERYEFT
jgi:hypothetical protein